MRRLLGRRPSRPRLTLLLAGAAALFLIPAASAYGANDTTIVFAGEGSGWVKGAPGAEGGEPHLECHWNGTEIDIGVPEAGKCETEAQNVGGFTGITVEHEADSGSEFGGWKVLKGFAIGCQQETSESEACGVVNPPIEIQATFEPTGPGGMPITINPVGSGSGQVNCKVDGGETDEPCEPEYAPGTELELIAVEDPGSEFAGFENGTGDAAGCTTSPCGPFTLEEASEVDARFELEPVPTFPLTATVAGEGEVTSTPGGIECTEASNGTAACEEEFAEGSNVELEAQATVEWAFLEWTEGPCEGSASALCEFAMPAEAEQAAALFVEANEAPLSLIKGGYFEGGTVTSSPDGINCGTACESQTASFEEGEAVTLTATAAEGYAFAGWLNCKYVSAGVCEVTVEGPLTEVTAIFLKDGEDGEGVTVTPEPPGKNCPNGGVKVEPASGIEYVCNGEDGEDGQDGAQGPAGQDGADGQNGSDGSNGQNGAPGPIGLPGPQGVPGPRGKPGPSGRIVCKTRQKGKRIVVRCRVKSNTRRAGKRANRRQRVRWALMQGGKAQSHGKTTVRRLQRVLNHAKPGRYVLRVQGQRGRRILIG